MKTYYDEHEAANDKEKAFAEQYPEEAKQLKELREQNAKAAVEVKLSEWESGKVTDGKALPPKFHEPILKLRVKLGEEEGKEFDEFMTDLLKVGPVKLGVIGDGNPEIAGDEAEAFIQKVNAVIKDDKKTFREAVDIVSRTEPGLAKAYKEAVPKV